MHLHASECPWQAVQQQHTPSVLRSPACRCKREHDDRLASRTHARQEQAEMAIQMLRARSSAIWFKSSTGLQRLFANGMQAVLKGFDYVNGQLKVLVFGLPAAG